MNDKFLNNHDELKILSGLHFDKKLTQRERERVEYLYATSEHSRLREELNLCPDWGIKYYPIQLHPEQLDKATCDSLPKCPCHGWSRQPYQCIQTDMVAKKGLLKSLILATLESHCARLPFDMNIIESRCFPRPWSWESKIPSNIEIISEISKLKWKTGDPPGCFSRTLRPGKINKLVSDMMKPHLPETNPKSGTCYYLNFTEMRRVLECVLDANGARSTVEITRHIMSLFSTYIHPGELSDLYVNHKDVEVGQSTWGFFTKVVTSNVYRQLREHHRPLAPLIKFYKKFMSGDYTGSILSSVDWTECCKYKAELELEIGLIDLVEDMQTETVTDTDNTDSHEYEYDEDGSTTSQ